MSHVIFVNWLRMKMNNNKQYQIGCQYGSHGEPFLWFGSEIDDVDIAVKKLIDLSYLNPRLALEACEFIFACVADAEKMEKKWNTRV